MLENIDWKNWTSEQAGQQAQTTYSDYKKIKGFEDVGYLLKAYVVSGGAVSKNVTRNDTVEVSEIAVSLNNNMMAREGAAFQTKVASTTYYLDFTKDGDWTWGTAHSVGVAGTDYLTIAKVTTDGFRNIASITDTRGPIGGLRLKSEYGLEDYANKAEVNAQLADITMNEINVLKYGADPTGQKDSTAAFDLAIADVTDNTIFRIPPGLYKVTLRATGALSFVNKNNFTVIGDNVKIYNEPVVVTGTTPNNRMIRMRNCSNFKISGIHFLYQNSWSSTPVTGMVRDEQLMQVFADTGEVCENFEISGNTFEYYGPSINNYPENITNRLSIIGIASQTNLGVYEHNIKTFNVSNNQFLNCLGRVIYCLLADNGSIYGNVMKELGRYIKPDQSEQTFGETVGIRLLASKNISVNGNTLDCYSGNLVNAVDHGAIHTFVVGSGGLVGMISENITFSGNTANFHKTGAWFFAFGSCDNIKFTSNTVKAEDTTETTYGFRVEQNNVHNVSLENNHLQNISAFYYLDYGTDSDYKNVVIQDNTHIWGNNTNGGYSTLTKKRAIIGNNYWSDKGAICSGGERQRVIYAYQLPPLTGSFTSGDRCINTGFDRAVCPVSEWVYEYQSTGVNYWRPTVFAISTIQPALPVVNDNERLQFRGLQYLDTTVADGQLTIWGGLYWVRPDGSRMTNLKRGTTAQRPIFTSGKNISFLYMDTTLNANGKPIWWTGTAWVDYTGVVV